MTEHMELENKYFKKFIIPLLNQQSDPDEIYHYTNIHGFEGIISGDVKDEKGVFWATHSDFLNDKTEMKYTLNLSKDIFKDVCKERGLTEEQIKEYTELYEKKIIEKAFNGRYIWEFYTVSFSINPDSNLLWSNYSNNDGYNIKFEFKKLIKENEAYCSHVIYDREKHEDSLKGLLLDLLDIFLKPGYPGKIRGEDKDDFMWAIQTLSWFSIFFKDKCFSQEEEFRIVFPLREAEKNNYKCRISNGTFIPFIERKFSKEIVTGVTIGPKNNMDINKEGLHKFLKLNKIEIPLEEIDNSAIPYRY
ncbi:DUF2971 domain-containing protein [Bacillus sp. AM 13(2015)]|uniref:DUF2971 domain-containing protein n=1 Tax=Bacillus sp. AM 13(2015) TaxID=1739115 RepID=UPI0007512D8F|nr:DUF2971 domain-containing protein [Bacillus sp. AM 13(2015)]KUR61195.1 hypothetical protein AOQ70_15850 [Bacillus sp. AM 13(2015)]